MCHHQAQSLAHGSSVRASISCLFLPALLPGHSGLASRRKQGSAGNESTPHGGRITSFPLKFSLNHIIQEIISSLYNLGLNQIQISNSQLSCNRIQNGLYLSYMSILKYFRFSLFYSDLCIFMSFKCIPFSIPVDRVLDQSLIFSFLECFNWLLDICI